jgi:hypothetical protein
MFFSFILNVLHFLRFCGNSHKICRKCFWQKKASDRLKSEWIKFFWFKFTLAIKGEEWRSDFWWQETCEKERKKTSSFFAKKTLMSTGTFKEFFFAAKQSPWIQSDNSPTIKNVIFKSFLRCRCQNI